MLATACRPSPPPRHECVPQYNGAITQSLQCPSARTDRTDAAVVTATWKIFIRRLLENYCFVLLANKALPQIYLEDWGDVKVYTSALVRLKGLRDLEFVARNLQTALNSGRAHDTNAFRHIEMQFFTTV